MAAVNTELIYNARSAAFLLDHYATVAETTASSWPVELHEFPVAPHCLSEKAVHLSLSDVLLLFVACQIHSVALRVCFLGGWSFFLCGSSP